MDIKSIKITTRLTLVYIIVTGFVIFLGTEAYIRSVRLWKITTDLYDHPFTVSRATRDVRNNCQMINNLVTDQFSGKDTDFKRFEFLIDSIEIVTNRLYDTVYMRYLGPKADIDMSYYSFKTWMKSTDQVLDYIQKGNLNSAKELISQGGAYKTTFNDNSVKIINMISFASNKADEFYSKASEEKRKIILDLVSISVTVIIIILVSGLLLFRRIRRQLNEINSASVKIIEGDYSARIRSLTDDELGTVSNVLNKMVSRLESDIKQKNQLNDIISQIVTPGKLKVFTTTVLQALLDSIGGEMAEIYILDNTGSFLYPYDSIGHTGESLPSFSVTEKEGVFGKVIVDKKIMVIRDIPDNIGFHFKTTHGHFRPGNIIAIPVVDYDKVVAIITLSGLHKYTPESLKLLEGLWVILNSRINEVLSIDKIVEMSGQMEVQNEELKQRSEELVIQSNELKRFNSELEIQKNMLAGLEQHKSRFLSNMSHELRTPLNSIITLTGVLERRIGKKATVEEKKFLKIIEKSGRHLLALVNDILEISRLESAKDISVELTEFSLREMVDMIILNHKSEIKERGNKVQNLISAEGSLILSDYTKCHHILQNIIGNAVKFTENGMVEISAILTEKEIVIKIKDTGIGIPQDQIQFIFDEFKQVDESFSRKFGGIGLGLSIAKRYCTILNGNISVESTSGRGSEFTVNLPVESGALKTNKNSGKPDQGAISDLELIKGKKILVVEDSEAARIQIHDLLEEIGAVPFIAENGQEALEVLKNLIPDAFIIDLMMPGIHGFDLVCKIRSVKETEKTPVLILTAKTLDKNDLSMAKGNGIKQLLQKGEISKEMLLSGIKQLFES